MGNKTEPFGRGEIVLVVPGMPRQWKFNPSIDDDGMIENISISFPTELVARIGTTFPEMSALVNWLNSLDHLSPHLLSEVGRRHAKGATAIFAKE